MEITKIHTTGNDFIICEGVQNAEKEAAKRLLDRKKGLGADGLIIVRVRDDGEVEIQILSPDGKEEKVSSNALIATAKFIYDGDVGRKENLIKCGNERFSVRLSVLKGRVLCAWIDMPKIKPRPMEQLKYYHGIRGEILRSCLSHPRVSLYSLLGEHAVFMLESAAAVKKLEIKDICTRLSEVLFYGESIDLHFAALSGENSLVMRSWRCRKGEIISSGEGATLSAYAAVCGELIESERVIVKTLGGSFCVELDGQNASLCAKCETVFYGEAI